MSLVIPRRCLKITPMNMKIKKGFLLCDVMGHTMAVSTGELENSFPGMIKMNESSADIWKWIEAGHDIEEIYALYADTYGIDAQQTKSEVDGVVDKMKQAGIFE